MMLLRRPMLREPPITFTPTPEVVTIVLLTTVRPPEFEISTAAPVLFTNTLWWMDPESDQTSLTCTPSRLASKRL